MITAQAVLYSQHGEPKDVLFTQKFEIDDENLTPNQVVVKTLASPVNPSDINQIKVFTHRSQKRLLHLEHPSQQHHVGTKGYLKFLRLETMSRGLKLAIGLFPPM